MSTTLTYGVEDGYKILDLSRSASLYELNQAWQHLLSEHYYSDNAYVLMSKFKRALFGPIVPEDMLECTCLLSRMFVISRSNRLSSATWPRDPEPGIAEQRRSLRVLNGRKTRLNGWWKVGRKGET